MAEVWIDDDLIEQKVKYHNKNIFCSSAIRQLPNRHTRQRGFGRRMGRSRMGKKDGLGQVNTGRFCERCLIVLRMGIFRHSIHAHPRLDTCLTATANMPNRNGKHVVFMTNKASLEVGDVRRASSKSGLSLRFFTTKQGRKRAFRRLNERNTLTISLLQPARHGRISERRRGGGKRGPSQRPSA